MDDDQTLRWSVESALGEGETRGEAEKRKPKAKHCDRDKSSPPRPPLIIHHHKRSGGEDEWAIPKHTHSPGGQSERAWKWRNDERISNLGLGGLGGGGGEGGGALDGLVLCCSLAWILGKKTGTGTGTRTRRGQQDNTQHLRPWSANRRRQQKKRGQTQPKEKRRKKEKVL